MSSVQCMQSFLHFEKQVCMLYILKICYKAFLDIKQEGSFQQDTEILIYKLVSPIFCTGWKGVQRAWISTSIGLEPPMVTEIAEDAP